MPDTPFPWFPRLIPILPPKNTPSIPDQLKCPPGFHRNLGRGCVPDPPPPPPKLVEIPSSPPEPRPPSGRERPPKEARGPLPVPPGVVVPPPPVVPSPSSPADVVRPSNQVRFPITGAGAATATTVGLLLSVLWSGVFAPYLRGPSGPLGPLGFPLPAPTGPPRRRGRVTTPTVPAPRPFWDVTYRPGYRSLPDWLRPVRGPFPVPRRVPVVVSTPAPVPSRPGTVPRTRTPVSTVPAPAPWTLGTPLPGPGYDPFTQAPPTPAPRAVPRSTPRTRNPVRLPVWFPVGDPVSRPATPGRPRSTPLTPQQPTLTPQPTPRLPTAPFNPLTPLQGPVPKSQPHALRKPTSANPCTTERTARRRRQKDCKRYTTKTIRVCAD